MKTVAVFLKWIGRELALVGRGRLWGALRSMDSDFLLKAGFVPELVQQGPSAWPWRAGSEENPSGDDTTAKAVRIDERGKPVPIDSMDQLNRIRAHSSTTQDPLKARHEAA